MTAKQLINKPEPVQQKSTSTGALAQSAGAEGGGLVQLEEEMALEKQQPPVEDNQQGDGGRFFTAVHSGRAASTNCK